MAKKGFIDIIGENFTLPWGYVNPENGEIHKEIVIREMTGADEEEIAKPEVRTNAAKIVTTLLANCVLKIGDYDVNNTSPSAWEKIMRDLYSGDRDFILLKLREITYGNEMSIDQQCPACRKQIKVSFEIDELENRPVKNDPSRIPFELPKGYRTSDGVHTKGFVRMPTGFDLEQLDVQVRKNPGVANTMLISRCVYELEGVELSSKVFRELSQKDREYLIKLLGDNVFGPKFTVEVVCENCGNEFEAGVNPVNFI